MSVADRLSYWLCGRLLSIFQETAVISCKEVFQLNVIHIRGLKVYFSVHNMTNRCTYL